MPRHAATGRALHALVIVVGSIALLQVLLGVAGLVASFAGVEWSRPHRVPDGIRAVQILAFSSLAAYLLLGARRDPRVSYLGVLFLLTADSYAQPSIHVLANALPAAATPTGFLQSLAADAFTPLFVWLFFRDFPRALEWRRSALFVRSMIGLSLAAGVVGVLVNLAIGLDLGGPSLRVFDKLDGGSPYWTIVFGLLLPAPPFILWRMRHAPEDERRRVRFFGLGIAVAAALPILYVALPPFSERIETWMLSEPVDAVLRPLVQLLILSIPVSTTYAVAIQRVLDVRTVLRRAAQYALARVAVGALAGLPLVALAIALYQARGEPLGALFTGGRLVLALGTLAAFFGVMRIRRGVMRAIDRLFLREPYDARQVLVEVAERTRTAASTRELARSLLATIDAALHVESMSLLVRTPSGDAYVPLTGGARSLPADASLVGMLSQRREPLRTALGRRSPVEALPHAERVWLADGAVEVAVPLFGATDEVIAILALGAKGSELAYSRDDLLLLSAVRAATETALDARLLRDSTAAAVDALAPEAEAAECRRCGRVTPLPAADRCEECGGELDRSRLPATVLGKFLLERRIGAGSMGVVYRARDLTLDRDVALKTLPATSPEDSMRLRREARAMAAITHPNLALIFGAESWQGIPILVMEYLPGGTLEDRLVQSPLGMVGALELALTIAGVLDRAHGAGLLHRDVKPSNVGYADDGVAKLLDFGLVRIAGEHAPPTVDATTRDLALTSSGLVGTPLYMSPEALRGERPNASFDLWSLGVVAFEAATGRHPFECESGAETLDAIRGGWTPTVRERLPVEMAPLAGTFEEMLSAQSGRRPATAPALARLLESSLKTVSRLTRDHS